ncbi:ANTAR domain-containing protein [Streptomyces griseorubiginosus]|uniref:ANTAR domain-containing protein n=1 Tax=Streptomyces griseorubiginosus TaxID=67304 RepID=UPI0033B5FABB
MRPPPPHDHGSEKPAYGDDEYQQLFDPTAELLKERDQLQHAMESRPVIDMARGVLMAGYGCRPEEAWQILVAVSQHANTKLHTVADAVTQAATGTPMPEPLQEHLAAAVKSWQARRESGSPG